MTKIELVLQARTDCIAELIEQCAKGTLPFDLLCAQVAAMGYKTTNIYEMVRAAEAGHDAQVKRMSIK